MSRIVFMIALILAGEMIFGLPYHTARFFRPTFLEVFALNNTQLGDAFVFFGVAALLSYFPGGAIADRFSPRKLMCISLLLTAAGGFYMATIPGFLQLAILYGFWGVTSCFFLWGALIKTTREWGSDKSQGMAFGLLEGGRGLAAVVFAQFCIFLFAYLLPGDSAQMTDSERLVAFQGVIIAYSILTALVGVFVWFAIPEFPSRYTMSPLAGMLKVIGRPIVWAQAAIIFCAYCGYKGSDYYTTYAVDVMGFSEQEGTQLFTNISWSRPLAALLAGILADRFIASRSLFVLLASLAATYVIWALITPFHDAPILIYANMAISLVFVFALRGVYFAMLEENQTPSYLTGAAVGMISLLGYTPDFLFAPIAGRIIDANPGALGYQHLLGFLAGIAILGVIAVIALMRLQRQGATQLWVGRAVTEEKRV